MATVGHVEWKLRGGWCQHGAPWGGNPNPRDRSDSYSPPPPPSTFPSLLPQPCPTGHLHHVHQVTETHSLINGEVPVSMQDTIVDDITAKTDTQDIVPRVTS